MIFAAVAAAVVFAVAAVAVGRVAGELGHEPYRPRFDLAEAVAFVAEALPDEEAGQLTHADVRKLIEWHLDRLDDAGVVIGEHDEPVEARAVLADGDVVVQLLNRAQIEGHAYTPSQVEAVLAAEVAYLEAIGAIGPPADGNGV